MRTTIVPTCLLALICVMASGCRSTVAPRAPQIRTIASIGDRPQSAGAGEPGDSQSTEPEASVRTDDEDRQISGRVVDDRGDPVANARVRVALSGSGAGRVIRASTDEAGRFTLHDLRQDSEYTLIAEDQAGSSEGRASAATADRRVRITLKGGSKVQRVSEATEESGTPEDEEPTSRDYPSIPPPPPPPQVESDGSRDRSASRASTGRSVAWRGSGSRSKPAPEGPELDHNVAPEELVAGPTPEPREIPDTPKPVPSQPERDDLPAPRPAPVRPAEPVPKAEKPSSPASLPTPEPEPIDSPTAPRIEPPPTPLEPSNPPPSPEPKPFEAPEPSRIEPQPSRIEPRPAEAAPAKETEKAPEPNPPPQPLETPSPIPEPMAAPEPTPGPVAEPAPSTGAEAPKPEEKGNSPEPAGGEAVEPAPSAPPPSNPEPPAAEPPKAADSTTNPGLRRPTWGEIAPRKSPQLAINPPANGRRRLLSPGSPAAKPAPADEQPSVTCQFDPKTKRLINFRLPDLQGNPVELRGFDADFVLLDFWGTWCGPCLDSIPHLVQLQQKYGERLQVVGIAYENDGDAAEQAKNVEAVAKRLGINYTVLLGGADGKPCPVQSALHVYKYPTLVLLDRQGRILLQDSGSTPQKLARLDFIVNARTGGSNVVRR